MAQRFHSEDIKSLEGYTYVIKIYDSSYSGSSHEFVCEEDGFQLTYENSSSELFKPINASRVEFGMYAKDAQVEGFIDDVVTAAENRFLVEITRNGSLFWYGKVVADIATYDDIARLKLPIYKLVAVDGLSLLANVDYNNAGTKYTGRSRLIEHIRNCLQKIGTINTFVSAGSVAAITVVNWYEDTMPSSASDDPLYHTRAPHEAFWAVDTKGNFKYKNCLDVLREILQLFGARIYQSNGVWRIEQITERYNASIKEIRYDRDFLYLNQASVNYTLNLDQATNAKLVGGQYTYYPPVRSVKATFNTEVYRNFFIGSLFTSEFPGTELTSNYNASVSTGTSFQISFNATRTLTYSNTPYIAFYVVYWMRFEVGGRYLVRNIDSIVAGNITYSIPIWSTTPGKYYFAFPYQASGSGTDTFNSGVIINTPSMAVGGTPKISFGFDSFRKIYDGSQVDTVLSQTYIFSNLYARLMYYGNYAEETVALENYASHTAGLTNSDVVEYEFSLGDLPNQSTINYLDIWNGSAFVPSEYWGSESPQTSLLSLLCKKVLAALKEPVERWQGTIKGQFDARTRFGWSSSHYIFTGGTLNARRDEWAGNYVVVAQNVGDISVANPVSLGGDPPDGKTPFNPVNVPSTFVSPFNETAEYNAAGVVGAVMSHVTTLSPIAKGAVTTIPLSSPVNAGVFTEGQSITIVNGLTGNSQNLIVTQTNLQGATSIEVSGYVSSDYPESSYVMVSPQNWTLGDVSGGDTSRNQSSWWEVYGQHWSIDQTNDTSFPIEGIDIVVETDEDAGDGSTSGIRFDGAGLAAYNNSATYPRFAVSTDGKVRIWQNNHLSAQSGLVYVKDGRIHHSGAEAAGMVPQFGHVIRQTVVGYDTSWTAGNQSSFISFTADYEDYEIYAIYWRLTAAGSNNNICYIQREDGAGAVNTMGTLTHNGVDIYGTIYPTTNNTLSNYDIIRFNINAITGTAPKGLYIELYLKVS